MSLAPGVIRDAIISFLHALGSDASSTEIVAGISCTLGQVSPSSVRSYLALNTPKIFERTERGRYRLQGLPLIHLSGVGDFTNTKIGQASLYRADCFDWLASQEASSVHAIVTDPPYGLVEYTAKETTKLRSGKGGIWRIPPSFDGHTRAPLPRFTVLDDKDRQALHTFFTKFALLSARVAVPGANIIIASNPLLSHIVADAMISAGLGSVRFD